MPFSSEFKWVLGACAAIGLILGGYKLYNLGYESAMATVATNNQIAIDAAVNQARIEWEKTKSITQEGMQDVQQTKQNIIYITQQAKDIVAPKCTDLGTGYSQLYNQYIDTIQRHANRSGNTIDAKVSGASNDENANPNR